jgi:hypothetical protein
LQSASTPVIAGFVSLVNAARLAVGKSSLGWLNPSIYAYGVQFTYDITSGKCPNKNVTCDARIDKSMGYAQAITNVLPVNLLQLLIAAPKGLMLSLVGIP